ncbi:cytidylyltransferase domain-containing protein [Aquimarina hainanensis]|uniref:Cytidylyltransferase domain-containing protein n=1 Tax=Aquimarina hainanensis TaxID=1578017 RepID=A0ABW5N6S7_9FLAO
MIVALLPMKGNSERVPNKNLKKLDGKPLFHRVLNVLLDSKYIDKVVINTDSEKIKNQIKKDYSLDKIIILDRPEYIIGDLVSMNKVIKHDIESIEADIYVQTHSTNPLLKTKSIDNAIEKMLNSDDFDSIFSVTKLQTRLYELDGKPFNHDPSELLRTQDLPPLFEENSNFYIFSKKSFQDAGDKRIGLKPFMFEIDKTEAIDIDDPEDFIIAESLYKLLR